MASYCSYGIIGCEIDKSKLYTSTKVRACNCVVDGKTGKENFCSKCGKEVWDDKLDEAEGFDESQDTLCGYDLRYNTEHDRCWVVIRGAEADDSNDAVKIESADDLSKLREELKAAIGPVGFWDEKKFGIWVINYCSY